jgi:hypothetical protein
MQTEFLAWLPGWNGGSVAIKNKDWEENKDKSINLVIVPIVSMVQEKLKEGK